MDFSKTNSCSIQGGGCLGIGAAIVLNELEKLLPSGVRLCDLFMGGIAGTSVGSIVGGALACGVPAAKVLEFFTKYAPAIFGDPRLQIVCMNPWGGCYRFDPDQLESALKTMFGDARLADCRAPFIATSIDMTSGRNVYFQSYGLSYEDDDEIVYGPQSGWKMWEVCRASAAAQSFFPAFVWDNRVFWDGGPQSNAPDVLLLDEVKDDKNVKMLSIGHGRMPWTISGRKMVKPSYIDVVKATLALTTSASASAAIWSAKNRIGDRHLRLDAPLGQSFGIDDATEKTEGAETNAWLKHWDVKQPEILKLFFGK